MSRLPVHYIPHGGGPCFFMDWEPKGIWANMERYLRQLPADITGDIKSLLVISAHWESPTVSVTGNPNPGLIYDYSGFPPHTYHLKWPAPGHEALASDVARRLRDGGVDCDIDPERGFDHGVFIPLLLSFPLAEVPTVQLSLSSSLSPDLHIKIGRLISPLRDQGVLIIGSGMSYHDVGALMGRRGVTGSATFDSWLCDAIQHPAARREALLRDWASATHARDCHPREEHLLPLHVVVGAAGDDAGTIAYGDTIMGAKISAFRFG
jgi:aromatic ring-opening dioxygenase catalytic subunit (LigB family)